MDSSPKVAPRAAIVSGGSAGLGLAIARNLLAESYRVTLFGRDQQRLREAPVALGWESGGDDSLAIYAGDATRRPDVERLLQTHLEHFGRLDALINVVGRSDRGTIATLDADHLRDLIDANVIATLTTSQVCLESLKQTQGVIVNIGSLASHVAPRYLGGYAIAKHALAAMTRQMRLECLDSGVHVGLVCPGPISRDGDEDRYEVRNDPALPDQAAGPGGGAELKQLNPDDVAKLVTDCIDRRCIEIIVPAKTRIAMLADAISPRLADWLLSKKTPK